MITEVPLITWNRYIGQTWARLRLLEQCYCFWCCWSWSWWCWIYWYSSGAAIPLPGGTTEISDIFDVLEGGEDEGTVRFLLGFNGEESVSLLSGVDGFVGMEADKYSVAENIGLNMTMSNMVSNPATTYLQPTAGNFCDQSYQNIRLATQQVVGTWPCLWR